MMTDTPIYDQMVLEHMLADQEGIRLVDEIHQRNSYAMSRAEAHVANQVLTPRPLVRILGGLFS